MVHVFAITHMKNSLLSGGDSDYFVNNITHFTLKTSVFDLAMMAVVKVIVIASFVSLMEMYTLLQIGKPQDGNLRLRSTVFRVLVFLLSFLSLAFSSTKGALVLHVLIKDKSYTKMHPTYNALMITAFVFSLLEFGMACFANRAMRNLKVRN